MKAMVKHTAWLISILYLCMFARGKKFTISLLNNKENISWKKANDYCKDHSKILPQIYSKEDYDSINKEIERFNISGIFWLNTLHFQDGKSLEKAQFYDIYNRNIDYGYTRVCAVNINSILRINNCSNIHKYECLINKKTFKKANWDKASKSCHENNSFLPSWNNSSSYTGWLGLSFFYLMKGDDSENKGAEDPLFNSSKIYFKLSRFEIDIDYIVCERNDQEDDSSNFPLFLKIILGCVGGIFLVSIILVLLCCCRCSKSPKKEPQSTGRENHAYLPEPQCEIKEEYDTEDLTTSFRCNSRPSLPEQQENVKNYSLEAKYNKNFSGNFSKREPSSIVTRRENVESTISQFGEANDYVEIQGLDDTNGGQRNESSTDNIINNRQSELIVTENDLYSSLNFVRS
ncbi:DgyrCDS1875 [Dimorphilus gyrociliatus]|uniref:DgyrCDS1875 n=1 Tax=Dimorphilus gyrociliatus TaxID=2664684 RepID=A0A7I8VBE8_9ANNE|nr:DgyrCDS1875 [Dimorphilus gyrociliatus]